ncbi:MAG: glycosyltransferase family 4 protein, partial [Sphingomonadales bacterium]|nr:glycosyltransferase family 4 protein [Sphingomonadales bacterium]
RLMRARRPAAYLGWTIKPNIYGALAARVTGVPAILNVSGLGTAFLGSGLFSRFVGLLYRVAFQKAHVVFFQNDDDRRLFVQRRLVRPAQARLLPGSGIDLDHFQSAPLPPGPPVFLLIARLLGDKGVREYVEAARRLRVDHPALRFQLLGPIDRENRTGVSEQELHSWVAEGVVDYLCTTNDVRPFIAAATIVVLPSYREGLPRTLLEGAAMGRPLIATDVPGCRDVVEDGINGLQCKVRDPASLAEAMRRMAALDEGDLRAMGEASRTRIERRFSQQLVADAYLQALRELVQAA